MKTKTTQGTGTSFLLLAFLLITANASSFNVNLASDSSEPGSIKAPNMGFLLDTMRYFSRPTLPESGGIKGRLVDAQTGKPIAFAGIFVIKDDFTQASTWSDTNGNFLIKGLVPDFYTVEFQINSYLRSTFNRVGVVSQELTALYVDMTYDPEAKWKADYRTVADSGILTGRVYCDKHMRTKKLEFATVTARDSNGIVRATAYTDDKGHFSLKLIPGTYTVEVQENHHKNVQKVVNIFLSQTSIIQFQMKEHQ